MIKFTSIKTKIKVFVVGKFVKTNNKSTKTLVLKISYVSTCYNFKTLVKVFASKYFKQ